MLNATSRKFLTYEKLAKMLKYDSFVHNITSLSNGCESNCIIKNSNLLGRKSFEAWDSEAESKFSILRILSGELLRPGKSEENLPNNTSS